MIRSFQSCEYRNKDFRCDFDLVSVGMFIEINQPIRQIDILLNGNIYKKITPLCIELYHQKVRRYDPTKPKFFLSFDLFGKIENWNPLNFSTSTLNFSRTARMEFHIHTLNDDILFYCKISSIQLNKLMYTEGMTGIGYFSIHNHSARSSQFYQNVQFDQNNQSDENDQFNENDQFDSTEVWINKIKQIDSDKLCGINLVEIKSDDTYCQCGTCRGYFITDSLKKWLETNTNSTCPLCRSEWTNYVTYNSV